MYERILGDPVSCARDEREKRAKGYGWQGPGYKWEVMAAAGAVKTVHVGGLATVGTDLNPISNLIFCENK